MSRQEVASHNRARQPAGCERKVRKDDILPRHLAILAILRIISRGNEGIATGRFHMEGVVYLAQEPSLKQYDCRLFQSFSGPEGSGNKSWYEDFHVSLDYLQHHYLVGWLVPAGHWFATPAGEKALDDYIEARGVMPIQPDEEEMVLLAAEVIRISLGLGRRLISPEHWDECYWARELC